MWELDHKEGLVPKNWCFQIVVKKTLDSPLDNKDIKPVNPKGNQSWTFIGRTDAEAPILWPPDANYGSLGKTMMLGKIDGRRRRGWQRMKRLDGITDSGDTEQLLEIVKDREAWRAVVHGVTKSWIWLSNWITIPEWSHVFPYFLQFKPEFFSKEHMI